MLFACYVVYLIVLVTGHSINEEKIKNEIKSCNNNLICSKSSKLENLESLLQQYKVLEPGLNDVEEKLITKILDKNLKNQNIFQVYQYTKYITMLVNYKNTILSEAFQYGLLPKTTNNFSLFFFSIDFIINFIAALFGILTWKECIESYEFLNYDYDINRDTYFYLWVGDKYVEEYANEKNLAEIERKGFNYDLFLLVIKYLKESKFDKIRECMASGLLINCIKVLENALNIIFKGSNNFLPFNIYHQNKDANFPIYMVILFMDLGHTLVVELQKNKHDSYTLTYYNSGAGLKAHDYIVKNGKLYFSLLQKYENVPKKFVEEILFASVDAHKFGKQKMSEKMKIIYPPIEYKSKSNTNMKYYTNQVSGTCSVRLYNAFALNNLSNFDHAEFKIKISSIFLRLVAEKYCLSKVKVPEIMNKVLSTITQQMLRKIKKLGKVKNVEPLVKAFIEPLLGTTNLNDFFIREFEKLRHEFITGITEMGYDTRNFEFKELIKRKNEIFTYETQVCKILNIKRLEKIEQLRKTKRNFYIKVGIITVCVFVIIALTVFLIRYFRQRRITSGEKI